MAGHSSLTPGYLNTKQASCAWILRTCATSPLLLFFLARRRLHKLPPEYDQYRLGHGLRSVRLWKTFRHTKTLTTFLKELYVEFDFEAVQKVLDVGDRMAGNDFFLGNSRTTFWIMRGLVSEAYGRVHQKIVSHPSPASVGVDLSERPNLSRDEDEKWIVREIHMGVDAKIDLEKNVIEINNPPQLIHQSVVEKTRGFAVRTQAIGAAVARAGAIPLEKRNSRSCNNRICSRIRNSLQ
ncbi:hypothetical protein M378DRAFT_133534 [Amanita muscaria Koide BX008]|uniref:Uncharacterized protein n=1 Tax=Amanita muscaria (strain Koide BX008) TaxID=946122 RepID=A0A0C2WLG6_AMAMK|nr:hypothetical protein M378DRAFT_133534 [Amanita muscaria Koide BX008]